MTSADFHTLTMRPYQDEHDIPAIVALINLAWGRYDENQTTVGEWQSDLSHPRVTPQRDVVLWETGTGELRALVAVFPSHEAGEDGHDAYVEVQAHPTFDTPEFTRHLLHHAEERMRAICRERGLPRMTLITGCDTRYTQRVALLDSLAPAYGVNRHFYRMQRPLNDPAQPILAPEFPAGFELVAGIEQTNLQGWVDMFNQSFIDHFNFHPTSVAEQQHFISTNPAYRPAMNLTALAPDGTLAAFCYTEIDAEYNQRVGQQMGLIGVLGVRRGFRRIGLGRAMLRAGLHCLQRNGAEIAQLGVDATNPNGAVRLYTSEGFAISRTFVSYGCAITPA